MCAAVASPKRRKVDHGLEDCQQSVETPYYLANFKTILQYLADNPDGHVVRSEKNHFNILQSFESVDDKAQRLLVRLYLRKHQWLRLDKIVYKDIADDLSPFITQLVQHQLLCNETKLTDVKDVLDLLQSPELKNLCKEMLLPSSTANQPKEQCIVALLKHCRQHRSLGANMTSPLVGLLKRSKAMLGSCVKVSPLCVDVFTRCMLLYSLATRGSDFEDQSGPQKLIYHMLQVQTGQIVYPQYDITITRPLFLSVAEFERFYDASQLENQITTMIEDKDILLSELTKITDIAAQLLQSELESYTSTDTTSSITNTDNISTTIVSTSSYVTTGTTISITNTNNVSFSSATTISASSYSTEFSSDSTSLRNTSVNCYTDVVDLTGEDDDETSTCIHNRRPSAGSGVKNGSVSSFFIQFTAGCVCVRVLTYCVECWEKLREYSKANEILNMLLNQEIFGIHRRGQWWERLTLNWDYHLGDKNKCLGLIKSALSDSTLHDSHRYSLLQRAHKLCLPTPGNKKARIKYRSSDFPTLDFVEPHEVEILGDQQPSTCLFLARDPATDTISLLQVEGYAIHYYTTVLGWPKALHAEGSTLSTLFVLLMWDIIFSSHIPDVFRGPYQSMPLDFGKETFYYARRDLIEKRLTWIRHCTLEELSSAVTDCWQDHLGENVIGITWDIFPGGVDDLKTLTVCIGGHVLSEVCTLFVHNYYHNRSGLPDLTLWDPVQKTCKFVEVKGPGDKLSHKQIIWLSRLSQWNCSAEVCRVKAVRTY